MKIKRTVIMILSLAMVIVPFGIGQAAPDKLGGGTHIVQWGENLASIADRYGTTVAAIVQANGLANADYIYIGQQLTIPTANGMVGPQPVAPPGGPAAFGGQGYTVRFGDTLTSIALRYGVTVNDLMAANGLRDSTIYIGQTLVVPGQGGGGMPTQIPGQAPVGQVQPPMAQAPAALYAVRPGDTLSAIAYRFGVTVNDIMQYNKLYSSIIVPGQQLAIPYGYAAGFDRPAGTYYTVQRGDTLAGLALRYGTTVSAILQANNLSQSQFIFPGQELVIPGAMTQFASPSMMAGPPQTLTFPGGPAPMSNPPMMQPQLSQGILQQPGAAATLPMSNPSMTQPQLSQGVPQQSSASGAPLIAPVVPGQPGQMGASTGAYQPPVLPMPPPVLPGVIIDNAPMIDAGRSSEAPELTQAWEGRLVSQTQPEDWRYPAVLRVNVGAAKGMQVTVTKLGSNSWSTTGFTGTKPEYGDGAVEFAPLNPGKHVVSLDGQGKGARMVVDIKPNSLTYVEFVRVRADTGPMS